MKALVSKYRRDFVKYKSVFKGWFEDEGSGKRQIVKHDVEMMKLEKFVPTENEVSEIRN